MYTHVLISIECKRNHSGGALEKRRAELAIWRVKWEKRGLIEEGGQYRAREKDNGHITPRLFEKSTIKYFDYDCKVVSSFSKIMDVWDSSPLTKTPKKSETTKMILS